MQTAGDELTIMSGPTASRKARALFNEFTQGSTDPIDEFLDWKRAQRDEEDEAWRPS